jgi:hypothetical protein
MAKPYERVAAGQLDRQDFKGALKTLDMAEQAWKAVGMHPPYELERADAYLGLGQFGKVLTTLGPPRHLSDPFGVTAACIAMVKVGRAKDARKVYTDQIITRHLPPLSYRLLPPKKTDTQFLATLWLARGIEFYLQGNALRTEHDLAASERLFPGQGLTGYFIGKLLISTRRSSQAAKYLKNASKLPGPLGQEAKDLLKK